MPDKPGHGGASVGWKPPEAACVTDIQGASIGTERAGSRWGRSPLWELRWRSDWCLHKSFHPKATMIATFFPLKKLRRNTRFLLFLAILLAGLAAVYHEMVASKAWSSDTSKLEVLTKLCSNSCKFMSGKLEHTVCANTATDHKQHRSLVWLQPRKLINRNAL